MEDNKLDYSACNFKRKQIDVELEEREVEGVKEKASYKEKMYAVAMWICLGQTCLYGMCVNNNAIYVVPMMLACALAVVFSVLSYTGE